MEVLKDGTLSCMNESLRQLSFSWYKVADILNVLTSLAEKDEGSDVVQSVRGELNSLEMMRWQLYCLLSHDQKRQWQFVSHVQNRETTLQIVGGALQLHQRKNNVDINTYWIGVSKKGKSELRVFRHSKQLIVPALAIEVDNLNMLLYPLIETLKNVRIDPLFYSIDE